MTCAVPNEFTIHALAGRPPAPPFSQINHGTNKSTHVHYSKTHRMLSNSGGSELGVSAIPTHANPGGGTGAHAYAAACFHSCPHTCRYRTGCGNNASTTRCMCVDADIVHVLLSTSSSTKLGCVFAAEPLDGSESDATT